MLNTLQHDNFSYIIIYYNIVANFNDTCIRIIKVYTFTTYNTNTCIPKGHSCMQKLHDFETNIVIFFNYFFIYFVSQATLFIT